MKMFQYYIFNFVSGMNMFLFTLKHCEGSISSPFCGFYFKWILGGLLDCSWISVFIFTTPQEENWMETCGYHASDYSLVGIFLI